MNQVAKYHSNNFLQARDVDVLLQKFKSKMKWDGEKKIIDIGSGPGNITYNYLFPLISNDTELLGIDISESMIQFANLHYNDTRLDFETWDILDPEVVEKYAINFDMAFSFYCFHWVQDQRILVKNLYSILKPGGETLFIQVVDSLNYVPYEILGESSKWSPYMKNYRNAIPPLRSSINPVFDMRNLMQNVGFDIKECSLAPISYTFPSKQAFYNWLEGLNPFSKNIPKHLAKEFKQEWKQIISDKNLYTYDETTNEVTITYLSLTVFAQKPYSASEI